jgi:predicted nucleic acid-binding protein
LTSDDFPGINAILRKYADQGFDLADAALMHLAQRESIVHVFTTDRRHFSVFRTAARKPLQLLPETLV